MLLLFSDCIFVTIKIVLLLKQTIISSEDISVTPLLLFFISLCRNYTRIFKLRIAERALRRDQQL